MDEAKGDGGATTLEFEGGSRDGLKLTWDQDAGLIPLAITFEDAVFDRAPDESLPTEEMLRSYFDAKQVGVRVIRYECTGMLADDDGVIDVYFYRCKDSRLVVGPDGA